MNLLDLSSLSPSQMEAVIYCDGPQLVIAGAGSGKTRVLTYKVAYLLQQGNLQPWNILALTFTNKAAKEMKDRVGALVGHDSARYLNMGTFHSVFSRILRNEAQELGYTHDFTIYDQNDSRSLVKTIIKEMGLDDKVYKASTVADRISMAKNHLMTATAYANNPVTVKTDALHKQSSIKDIYYRYAQRCRLSNAMDFDDLLLNTYLLFRGNEETRLKYVDRFRYVLVDEYQDTNIVQQAIIEQLTREHLKVCAVGDDAQSIYSFRGANIDNILDFGKTFSNARIFKLEQNYRSTQSIVEAANRLIRHNRRQIPKTVYSEKEAGKPISVISTYSDQEESLVVVRHINSIIKELHLNYNDFAILYRTNAQSRSFEETFRKQGIPYQIYGGLSFYQRKEIKDVVAYFRLVANPNDEEAFKRVVNYPTRGIGATSVSRILATATDAGVSVWQAIAHPELYPSNLGKAALTRLQSFQQMVEEWRSRILTEDAFTLGRDIIVQSGIFKDIHSGKEPEDRMRQENLDEFLNGMQAFVETRREVLNETGETVGQVMPRSATISDFLQEVSLLTDADHQADDTSPKVSLMTIHSAKGLEFPIVFIAGVEENIFPSPMSLDSPRALEEERRLLYVAITRAERQCYLSYAQNRYRYGRLEFDSPSRFLRELELDKRPKDLFCPTSPPVPVHEKSRGDTWSSKSADGSAALNEDTRSTVLASPDVPLAVGNVIEHQRFGIGEVLKMDGAGENAKATVAFKNAGTKQLLLKFAKYTIIS